MIDLLLNESFVRAALNVLAAATPLLALLLYFVGVGRGRVALFPDEKKDSPDGGGVERESAADSRRAARVFLVAFGMAGPLVWLLWRVYEAIMDHFGFASVKGLLIVLGLSVVLGLLAGWGVRRAARPDGR